VLKRKIAGRRDHHNELSGEDPPPHLIWAPQRRRQVEYYAESEVARDWLASECVPAAIDA
jgi:hypothetical protein